MGKSQQNVIMDSGVIYPNQDVVDGMITTTFAPMGVDRGLQDLITQGLDQAVREDPTCTTTLAEFGYLHFSSIEINDKRIQMKLYFDPRLCTNERVAANGQKSIQVKPELVRLLNNRFIIVTQDNPEDKTIDLTGVVGVEKILAPQGKIKYDELGKPALYLKKDATDLKAREVIVFYCNLTVSLAYLLDINVDAGYHISTMSASNKASKSKIMIDGYNEIHPVWITVRFHETGYQPAQIVNYLRNLMQTHQSVISHQKEILKEAKEEKSRNDKKKKSSSSNDQKRRSNGW